MEYRSDLPARLLAHFSFSEEDPLPTFSEFRRREGMRLCEFRAFLAEPEFAAAAEEARERVADALRAGALCKRYDPSFVKYLLSEAPIEAAAERFAVEIRVVE